MRIPCPHCKERTFTRTSKRQTPVFYEWYVVCTNCGWNGKVHVEIAITTTPSRLPDPEIRIPLDPQARAALLAQLGTA